jgi:hypothetical protein
VLATQSAAITQGLAEWGTGLFAVLGYITAIVVGLPAFLLLKRHLSTRVMQYVVLGAVLGVVPGLFLFVPDIWMGWGPQREHAVLLLGSLWRALFAGTLLGGLSGAVFWLIAIRPR